MANTDPNQLCVQWIVDLTQLLWTVETVFNKLLWTADTNLTQLLWSTATNCVYWTLTLTNFWTAVTYLNQLPGVYLYIRPKTISPPLK
jgi:hypothetical protein